ncbi:hypothetical protein EC973_007226 [Apophysomyces ossiformis]|uniref:histidine kinase n=1 Tax=Apophysomyces ossiformis TaxID=679940 RepID=A0A8H7EJP8_9FUNG|nr:hypothetical protein EC973_007226 [Apophysomyces ossiformis]
MDAERSSLSEEQTEHLQVIQTSGHHLLTLINDILDISKLNHDPRFKLEKRRFSLRKCVKDTLHMARHQASMNQQSKLVHVAEVSSVLDDNEPLNEAIAHLQSTGVLLLPTHPCKNVLPLLWSIEPDVPDSIVGDTMRLTQIMLNLCTNAVKFTTEGGICVRIKRYAPPAPGQSMSLAPVRFKQRYDAREETVWTRTMLEDNIIDQRQNDQNHYLSETVNKNDVWYNKKVFIEISVTDTGIGIPADRLPKLFTSFSQIDISTARRYGGTGLGLAISSTLVNHMDGGLWVESDEGVGSCFAFVLPMEVAPVPKITDCTNYARDDHDVRSIPSSPSTIASGYSVCNVNEELPGVSSTVEEPIPLVLSDSMRFGISNQSVKTSNVSEQPEGIALRCDTNGSSILSVCHLPNAELPLSASHSGEHTSFKKVSVNRTYGVVSNHIHTTNVLQVEYPMPQNTQNIYPTEILPESTESMHEEEELVAKQPMNIMLAEDNILNQKIAMAILGRLGYKDVTIANNGREMDLWMPEMDGFEATQKIMAARCAGDSTESGLLNASEQALYPDGNAVGSEQKYHQ